MIWWKNILCSYTKCLHFKKKERQIAKTNPLRKLLWMGLKSNTANIHLNKKVLKTSWRRLSSLSSEDIFKKSWSRRIYSPYSYVFRGRLDQDQYIPLVHTSSRRLQDLFKTSYQDDFKMFLRRLQDICKMSCQDVLKTTCKSVFKTSPRRCEDVFKTSSRHLQDALPRRPQDVFKMSSRCLAKPFSSHL